MIKAITFDCWDTLVVDDESRDKKRKEYFRLVLDRYNVPKTQEEIVDLFSEEAKIFQDHIVRNRKTQNAITRAETLIGLAKAEIPASEIAKIAEFSDKIALKYRPPLVQGIIKILEDLSKIYILGLICNTGWHSGETVRSVLQGYDLPKYFAFLSFSDEVGVAKPHKKIFELTVDRLGFRTEEAAHIGDSEYSDIVGAKQANMKAVLFTGINAKYKNNNTADAVINSYDNFLNILQAL